MFGILSSGVDAKMWGPCDAKVATLPYLVRLLGLYSTRTSVLDDLCKSALPYTPLVSKDGNPGMIR